MTPPDDSLALALAQILEGYRAAEPRMRDVDLCNPRLEVAAVGFDETPAKGLRVDGAALGVIVTPWSINATLIPMTGDPWADRPVGEKSTVALPSGLYAFVLARMETGPSFRVCSLFSPCFQFENHSVALMVAEAALQELTTAEAPTPTPTPAPQPQAPSRRDLFRRLTTDGGGEPA